MKRLVLFVSLVFAALTLAGCQDRTAWNQKLTVTVETPSRDVTGTSVSEVVAMFGQIPGSASEVNYQLRGEATMVEVAPGRYLFALLGERDAERLYIAVYGMNFADRGRKLAALPSVKDVKTLDPGNYPLLVTFDDVNDPKTVKRVDPADLAASFGPGHALKSITLEITDEKVAAGKVESVLGWLRTVGDGMLDGAKISTIAAPNRLANDLSRLDFKRK